MTTRTPPSIETRVQALEDIWVFADMIGFHGGQEQFGKIHKQLTGFLTVPQTKPFTNLRRLVLMPRGHLKAQPLTTPVLTPTGFKPLGSLVEGDMVIGRNGTPVKVLITHPISRQLSYRVTTKSGKSTLANAEHLWEVIVRGKTKVLTTLELQKYIDIAYIKPIPVQHSPLGSYEQRLELLRESQTSFSDKSLADDLISLVHSLGGLTGVHSYEINGVTYYQVTVELDNPRDYIVSVVPEGEHDMRCITVEDELYIVDDYLPTHNSTVASVLYVLWRIYRNPNIRVITGTNQKRLSRGFIRELRQYLEDDFLQEHVWNKRPHVEGVMVPALSAAARRSRRARVDDEAFEQFNEAADKKVIWGQEALQIIRPTIMKEPTIQTLSVGTVLTGDHADLVVLDDIVDFRNSDTQDKAETILDWTRDLESILDPRTKYEFQFTYKGKLTTFVDYLGDEVVVLGTRYYRHDFYGYIIENHRELDIAVFEKNVFVNGVNDSKGYLWGERFNAKVIASIKKRLNSVRRFASQYLNKIITEEEMVFLWEDINFVFEPDFDISPGMVRFKMPVDEEGHRKLVAVRPIITIDPAGSDKETADKTVIVCGGFDENMNMHILDYKAGNFTTKQIIEHVFGVSKKWSTPRVYIETNGVGAYLPFILQQAIKDKKQPLLMIEHRAKGEKKARIQAMLEPYWNTGKFYMNHALSFNTDLRDEIENFPSKGGNDDILDAMEDIAQFATKTQLRQGKKRSGIRGVKSYNSKYGGVR